MAQRSFFSKIISLDKLLDAQWPLFVALTLLFFLRIPNLVEPYWYGDEGIYLTIGQSLNKGLVLYKDIIDHKTPLIYFLAQTHTQLNFRLLLLGWMLVTTTCFYYFAQKLFAYKKLPTTLATLLFVLATTLPAFEGHIPNGELFVLGFVLMGMLIISRTNLMDAVLELPEKAKKTSFLTYMAAGGFFSLGILTKVPALFDFVAVFAASIFPITAPFFMEKKQWFQSSLTLLYTHLTRYWVPLLIGSIVPILLSVLFFVAKGAGQEYLDFGLLYNFRYAGSWGLPFTNPVLLFLFTLPGKTLVLAASTLVLVALKKYLTPTYQFILLWFGLSLFASLLSNRPYPHYYLQIAPAVSLLAALLLTETIQVLKNVRQTLSRALLGPLLGIIYLVVFVAILLLLRVGTYQVVSYYTSFFALTQGKITAAEYAQKFDGHMRDNYKAVAIMEQCPDDYFFIWGTNPMLYALADRIPTGRFTVSFHIADFNAYEETYNDLVEKKPSFIVVMDRETSDFPEFYSYLHKEYVQTPFEFDTFTLWNRIDCTVTNY